MKNKIKDLFCVFSQILKRDLLVLRRSYFSKSFDFVLMFFTSIVVFGYFLPGGGSGSGRPWGPFIMVGAIAIFGLFSVVMDRVAEMIVDLNGDRTIYSFLVMPISSTGLFISMALSWSMIIFILALILFPVGALVLYNQIEFSLIEPLKVLMIYSTCNLFFGFFSLWLSSIFQKNSNLSQLWCRVINPIFMFGAYFYSWKEAMIFSPLIAKLTLLNPVTYVTEGMRSAMLGQEDYLNYWICLGVLWFFIVLCGWDGSSRLKKGLDCV